MGRVSVAATSLADVLPLEALSEDGAAAGIPEGVALGRSPEAVVHPLTTDEVAATLEWASAHGVGVLPLASGRRLGGRTLDGPYVLLRTDRLRGIEIYEPADLTLTARAGSTLGELGEQLGARRQWLPFDPPHVAERSLGGLVASGESGPAWMGYGDLRNHVLGMTVVTGDGRTLRLGGRVVKNVAGFDLLKPMVGSRGRLAVITSVCMRVFPRPAADRLLVLRAGTPGELCDAARAVGTAPVLPASCVLVAPARTLAAGAALLVRLHGALPTVEADQRTLERHCGVTFELPGDAAALLAEARDAATGGAVQLLATVLPSRLAEAVAAVEGAPAVSGARSELVADAYLGRIRVTPHELDVLAASGIRTAIEGLGGSLTVVVGSARDQTSSGGASGGWAAAASAPAPATAELVAGLERVFDPRGVLWPCRA